MNRLQAHEAFCNRQDRSILDADATVGDCDCWPSVATAAVELAGRLEDAKTDADLDAGVLHFFTLLSIDVVDESRWRDVAFEILADLEAWGMEVDRQAVMN